MVYELYYLKKTFYSPESACCFINGDSDHQSYKKSGPFSPYSVKGVTVWHVGK